MRSRSVCFGRETGRGWPLVSLSPTVEPFIVFGYITFYFGPYFPAIWILRKMQARGPSNRSCGVTR